MIPKIIHHLAPRDKSKWHPIWEPCYESWKEQYDGYIFKMWNHEDWDPFIEENYPEYFPVFKEIKKSIVKIDFLRFCILHKYGGIYADMDIFCYKNFYDKLNNRVHLIQSPEGSTKEIVGTCLMASEKNSTFFKLCADISIKRIADNDKEFTDDVVMDMAGPHLVSDVYLYGDHKIDDVSLLPFQIYNPNIMSYDESYFTKHMLTGQWGSEYQFTKEDYLSFRGIDIDKLDFRKEYISMV